MSGRSRARRSPPRAPLTPRRTLLRKTKRQLVEEVRELQRLCGPPAAGRRRPIAGATREIDELAATIRADYERLYAFGPVLWMLLDVNGQILDINERGCEVLGGPPTFIAGTRLHDWLADTSDAVVARHIRRTLESPGTMTSDVMIRSRQGISIALRLFSRKPPGVSPPVLATVGIDRSEEVFLQRARAAEEERRAAAEEDQRRARAAEAAKDELIAMVSHELRNPLSPALVAATSLAASEELPSTARQLALVVKRNVEMEARLIDDLLDIARVTRGHFDLRLESVDVHEVVREAVEVCASAARVRDVDVSLDLAADPHHTQGDRTRLGQVFWNLLSNAIKFSTPGGTVTVRSVTQAGLVRVSVVDRGDGMDAETMELLFTPFVREGPRDARSGLGLGLTITRHLVEAHHGAVWASSEGPGQGSAFEVELIASEAPAASMSKAAGPDATPVPPREPAAARVRHGRVLLVEDHEDTGSLLAWFLGQHGYEVRLAASLAEAIAALRERWDVVLSDIGLADGSGLDVARRLQRSSHRPALTVALTGFGSARDVENSRIAGFDRHLVKPVDLDALVQMIDESLGVRS